MNQYDTEFLKNHYYPLETNVDILKPWHENYGPFYQADRSYYQGKIFLAQEDNVYVNAYKIYDSQLKNHKSLALLLELWEAADRNADGTWSTKRVYPFWAILDVDVKELQNL